MIDQKNSCN